MNKKSTKTTKTTKTTETATVLANLFGVAVADLKKLEEAESNGLAAVAAFGTSSENLLKAILPETEKPWVFAEDLKPYDIVRDSIVRYAHETGDKNFKIESSIAGGKYRAAARESDNELVRLSGRLAGRLSTLISNAKKAKEESSDKTKGKSSGKGEKGDKYARGFDDGFMLGRADLVLDLLDAFPKDKAIAAFIKEQKISAKVLAEARERRASAAASAAAKKAA